MKIIKDIFYMIAILILLRLNRKKAAQLLKEWGENCYDEPFTVTREEQERFLKNLTKE